MVKGFVAKGGVCVAKRACMAKGGVHGEGGIHVEGDVCGKGGGMCMMKGGHVW